MRPEGVKMSAAWGCYKWEQTGVLKMRADWGCHKWEQTGVL